MSELEKPIVKSDLSVKNIDKHGRFVRGNKANPTGRNGYTTILEMEKAINDYGEKHNTSLLKHIAKRFYINDNIVIAILKKLIPDKIKGEGFGDKKTLIFDFGEIDPGARRRLIEVLRAKRGIGQSVQPR